jgi:hypothetical protein
MKNPLIISTVKILIPFIILGARPTSTPGPKRDRLVEVLKNQYWFLFFKYSEIREPLLSWDFFLIFSL